MRNILIVSLNYSPAFTSHMLAYGECSKIIGCDPYYLVNNKYVDELKASVDREHIIDGVNKRKYFAAIICNVGLEHMVVATLLKMKGVHVFYVFHEPDFSFHRIINESVINGVKLVVASICSAYISALSSNVLLPSRNAMEMYRKKFSVFNSRYTIFPLLFSDEYSCSKEIKRDYFSYIGTATESHNFEDYIKLIKYIANHEKSIKFCIGTKNDISDYIDDDMHDLMKIGRLIINSGRVLTNEEINSLTEQSFCVWNAYKVSTQSGVLVRSFMMGTPVLATDVGSFKEYIKEGYNGVYIKKDQDSAGILKKIISIKNNIKKYNMNCRKSYDDMFSTRKNAYRFNQIINS